MIVIDGNHLAYRILFANTRGINEGEGGWRYFRHLYLNSIISVANKFQDGKIIVAMDHKSWRKKLYPEYKAGREKGRDESPIDFKKFFKFFSEFEKELQAYLPLLVIKIKQVEADDIVAALAKNWKEDRFKYDGEEMIVVSSDKDLHQVKRYDTSIRVYDPIKRSFVKEGINAEDAEFSFRLKVMLGDPSDNIPGIEKGVGPARAAKILNLPEDKRKQWFLDKPDRLKRWSQNVKLISFLCIPPIITETAYSVYERKIKEALESDIVNGHVSVMEVGSKAESYCRQHGLNNIRERIDQLVDNYAVSMRKTYKVYQENV